MIQSDFAAATRLFDGTLSDMALYAEWLTPAHKDDAIQAMAQSIANERNRLIALIEADAKTCDCFARSEDECACGAWDDYKQVSLARVIDILNGDGND